MIIEHTCKVCREFISVWLMNLKGYGWFKVSLRFLWFKNQSLSCQLVFQPSRFPPLRPSLWDPAASHLAVVVGGQTRSFHCSTAALPGSLTKKKIRTETSISQRLETLTSNRTLFHFRPNKCRWTNRICLAQLCQCFAHDSRLRGARVAQASQRTVQWCCSNDRGRGAQKTGVTDAHGSQRVAVPPQGGQQLLLWVSPLLHGGKEVWEEVLGGHRCCVPPECGKDGTLHFLLERKGWVATLTKIYKSSVNIFDLQSVTCSMMLNNPETKNIDFYFLTFNQVKPF